MFNLGMPELLVIGLLVLLFAAKRPDMGEAVAGRRRPRQRPLENAANVWTLTDWLVVAAVTALAGTLAAALLQHRL